MAEGDGTGAQHLFAQDGALRVHHRERSVVANRADVTQVIRDPLELGHHRAQPHRARRRVELECRLHGASEDKRIRHRAVPGHARRNSRSIVDRFVAQQLLDALVGIAEALLEPDNGFAARREAKMSGLDDPGMHRTDRNLMQTRTLRLEKPVGRQRRARPRRLGQWRCTRPASVIDPRPRIGQPDKFDAEQIADRPLQARCRRVKDRKRRDLARVTSIDALTICRVAGSYSAQCTAATSPHSPSRSSLPSRSASPMPRHRSESTATRGHGRWVGAAREISE